MTCLDELFFFNDTVPYVSKGSAEETFVSSGWYVTNKFVWDVKAILDEGKAAEMGLVVYMSVETPQNPYQVPCKAVLPYWASARNKQNNNRDYITIEGFQAFAARKADEANDWQQIQIQAAHDRIKELEDSIDQYAEAVSEQNTYEPWFAPADHDDDMLSEANSSSPQKQDPAAVKQEGCNSKPVRQGGGWMATAINLLTAILQNNSGKSWDLAIKYTHGSKDVFWAVRGCLCSGFFVSHTRILNRKYRFDHTVGVDVLHAT